MGDFNSQKNRAVWFDVPVADLDRATNFYAKVLAIGVSQEDFNGFKFSVLHHEDGNGGCLVPHADQITSTGGILLYLNANGRIRDAVAQVKEHGGKILEGVHSIGPHGFRALILDSEGNRVALHSETDA
ncbi:MAG: VOC family protein [Planctomycetaceae bacterium]|mgnify:CR=1 FL=1|nr:VOC family protein [Planctomycetales bacterium]MCB9937371.1 VOC family protein [Planctomycetaceae bacterium]